jgi:putative peptide zinc metalloprotease protein
MPQLKPQPKSEPKPVPKLPRLRQDLKLYPGSVNSDGSPSWRILDPVRNRFFDIGWLEFELLLRWNEHADPAALMAHVASETTLEPSEDEVKGVAAFLEFHQLAAPGDFQARSKLKQRWLSSVQPWYMKLLHSYLFFRIPLVRPDRFLEATLPAVEFFFSANFFLVVAGLLLADFYLVFRDWENFKSTFLYFFTVEGLLFYALAASFAKVIHELAHAYTAKRYGVRVPTMGIALLVLWPVLYTDTSETWKLADRKKQFAISAAGISSELVLAVFATFLWSLAPEGSLKSAFFLLATTTWMATLAINASPFMRFDGYFLLSDALDFPNLHERSSALASWWVRTTFFRLDEEKPEPNLSAGKQRWLIAFALITWIYRFVVFLGIALLVYHMFFKLLGIFLFLIEIGWFIVKPLYKEAAYLWARRSLARPAWIPILLVFLCGVSGVWLLPVTNEVSAPAVLRAQREQVVYAPFASQLQTLAVRSGQIVEPEALLALLDTSELQSRLKKAVYSIKALEIELERIPANEVRRERMLVLQQELEEAQAEQRATREELERLEVRAAFRGVVRDVPPDLAAGHWVSAREVLMRVVSFDFALIEAYVGEDQARVVRPGQRVTFYSTVKGVPPVPGRVIQVDTSASKQVARPLLSSTHGGDLAAVASPRGGLVAHEATYRVIIHPESMDSGTVAFVSRGTVRIQTDVFALAQNFFTRFIALLIRESGF